MKRFDLVVPVDENVHFIDGNDLCAGMNRENISALMEQVTKGSGYRAGWYFQQFIKMAYAFYCDNEYYAVIDLDTVPNKINFFDQENPVFFISDENHQEYFETMESLLPGRVQKYGEKSFVNQFMIFNKKYMLELIRLIGKSDIAGDDWWCKIINAINPEYISKAGFSEFETYGNYVMNYHPDTYKIAICNQCRSAAAFISMDPRVNMLKWAFESYDVLTLEKWSASSLWYSISKCFYKFIPMRTIARIHDIWKYINNQSNYHLSKFFGKKKGAGYENTSI